MKKRHLWMTGAVLAAILGLVYAASPGSAGDDNKELIAMVKKIAAAIKSGDKSGARAMAEAYAKKADSIEDVMDLFKKKDKGGIGFGAPPKETDGIEVKIREVARDVPKDYTKNAARYEEMGYNTAAIGLIGEIMTPKKDVGTKTIKGWKTANADMQEAAIGLAKAKGAAEVKTAASKLNNACIACHAEHRK
jgi:hypothetical protein